MDGSGSNGGVGLMSSETELVSRLHDHRQSLLLSTTTTATTSNGNNDVGEDLAMPSSSAVEVAPSHSSKCGSLRFAALGPSGSGVGGGGVATATLDRRLFQQQMMQQRRQRGNEYVVVPPEGISISPMKYV